MQPNQVPSLPPTDENQGFYQPDNPRIEPNPDPIVSDVIEWEASEFIHQEKGATWVVVLAIVTLIFVTIAMLFRAWTFAALIVVMGICFGVYGFRKPRTVRYRLTQSSFKVGEQNYNLSDFRAFGVIPDGAFYSVVLIPVKRFMPALTIYFANEDGDKILDILGAHLPMQEMHPNPVDVFVRRLRF